MAENLLRLESIDSDDQTLVGEKLFQFSQLFRLGINVRDGWILTFSLFEKPLSSSWQNVEKFLPRHFEKIPSDLYELIYDSAEKNFIIDPSVQSFLQNHFRKHKTFSLTAFFENEEGDAIVLNKLSDDLKKLSENLTSLWSSLLNQPFIEKHTVKELSSFRMSLLIAPYENPHVTGTVVSDGKGNYTIKSQWGEINKNEESDRTEIKKEWPGPITSVGKQKNQTAFLGGKITLLPLPQRYQNQNKLSSNHLEKIVEALSKIDRNFLLDYEIKFSFVNEKLFVDNISFNVNVSSERAINNSVGINLPQLAKLTPLFPGIVVGQARIFEDPHVKKLNPGEIGIVEELTKKNLSFVKKATGLILKNKPPFHLIKQLSIPAVVGNPPNFGEKAITLDGKTGKIYQGAFTPYSSVMHQNETKTLEEQITKTATKVFLSVDHPHNFVKPDNAIFDGIGPIRGEKLFYSSKIHPSKTLSKTEGEKLLLKTLIGNLEKIAAAAENKPIIYQISDLQSEELLNLEEGGKYETKENNPLLGKRGVFRHLTSPQLVNIELKAIKELRNKALYKNINITLPFVRTVAELERFKKLVSLSGLHTSPSFHIYLTASLPANLYQLRDFKAIGINGILINYLEISSLAVGRDLSFQELRDLNESGIEELIKSLISESRKISLPVFLYGFPLESQNNFLHSFLKVGLKGVCTHPDDLVTLRKNLHDLEKNLVTA